jgi:predicted DCC family thiol-disulfide oxidoreductase YuxK
MTLLYDGACPFCTRSARAVQRALGEKRVALHDFQQPGGMDAYPDLAPQALKSKMHVVMPEGPIFAGAEAFARIFARLPGVGWLAWLYYVPGLRQIADGVYAFIAKHRYRLFGRAASCGGETCGPRGL